MTRELRDYQNEGKLSILNSWNTDDYLMYVLATGGGKTVIFTEIIKHLIMNGNSVLLIAHRTELITQAWQTLYDNKIMAGIIMNTYPETPERLVQICSIQTLARRKTLPKAKYIIIDEGHHAQPLNSYGTLLMRFSESKVLMVSATPYRLSGEGFEFIHKYKKTKLILGPDLADLTENGWLVPLEYNAVSVPDLSKVSISKGDYAEEDSKKAMELAPLVESYFEHASGKCGVVFAINVEHSKSIVANYIRSGIPAAHLDANTLPFERNEILAKFKAREILVIVNVGIITEGYDFPDLEFVQLACPTKSLSKFLQMVGRVTRVLKGLADGVPTASERKNKIKQSKKSCGIILDNAGCWLDHGLPNDRHDWYYYFKGAKRNKANDGLMDILIFVAEDKNGNRIRTTNAKEVEGLKLVRIDKEERKKSINLKSLREFDAMYLKYKRLSTVKKPGYLAVTNFIEWCNRNNILLPEMVWDYMKKALVDDIGSKLNNLSILRAREMEIYSDEVYAKETKRIELLGVSEQWLYAEKMKYFTKNERALASVKLVKTA